MFKISEFAKLARTTRRTLLFYDERGLFSPSLIADNGYRYYEADQLYQFEMISSLRKLDVSIPEIKEILSCKPDQIGVFLEKYQLRIQDEIKRLENLNRLIDMQKEHILPFKTVEEGTVHILPMLKQVFFCSELEVDCRPEDIAHFYSDFMEQLGEVYRLVPNQSGFLTYLPLDKGKEYMSASFRFIKEECLLEEEIVLTKVEKPAGLYLSIKVNTEEEDIIEGLTSLWDYVQANHLRVNHYLWQLNVDGHLIKSASSQQQMLQYEILESSECVI